MKNDTLYAEAFRKIALAYVGGLEGQGFIDYVSEIMTETLIGGAIDE